MGGIQKQLSYQPFEETRNRKRMRPNPVAPWELRLGALRVYYDLDESGAKKVLVRAVGVKVRDQVTIAGEVIKL